MLSVHQTQIYSRDRHKLSLLEFQTFSLKSLKTLVTQSSNSHTGLIHWNKYSNGICNFSSNCIFINCQAYKLINIFEAHT